jgi:hypothetical protein
MNALSVLRKADSKGMRLSEELPVMMGSCLSIRINPALHFPIFGQWDIYIVL